MDRLDALALFVDIVEKGGLSAAGREHGLSPATVSERLAALESHYGARLLNRTTRSVSTTDAGARLLEGARRLLAESAELDGCVRDGAESLTGPIRLSAPSDLGRARVLPVIDRLLAEHPGIGVDVELTDGRVDIVARGFDLVIRAGAMADSTLRARPLGTHRRRVCAAPAYLERHGVPSHPTELIEHNCLLMRFGADLDNAWPFAVDGEPMRVLVRGNRTVDDGGVVRQWCVAGHGLALKSEWDVAEDLAEGRLVSCLDDFAPPPTPIQIVLPSTTHLPRRVRRLVEALVDDIGRFTD